MIRLGMTLGVKEEKIEEYKKLHANVWPEVLENLTELNFKNYSIYLHKNTLFGYVEYHGDNLDRDNKLMASNPKFKSGGVFVDHVKFQTQIEKKENGGLVWKKFFITTKVNYENKNLFSW